MRRREFAKLVAAMVAWPDSGKRAEADAGDRLSSQRLASRVLPMSPRSTRDCARHGYVEDRTWRSNTAGRRATMIGCRHGRRSRCPQR